MLTRDFYPSLNGMVVFTFWEQGWPYMCTGWMDNEQLRGYGESRSEEGVYVCAVVLGKEKSPETGRDGSTFPSSNSATHRV